MIRLMIVGAAGRMGKEVIRAAAANADLAVASAVEHAAHPDLGKDAGAGAGIEALGVAIGSDLRAGLEACDAVIDFSLPESSACLLEALVSMPRPAVVGTTGLDDNAGRLAAAAAAKTPLIGSPNLSYGVAVLRHLTRSAAALLQGFDVEVMEIHHRNKQDAPSGTAAALLSTLVQGSGRDGGTAVHGRHGKDAKRRPGEVGVHALRGGSVTGEHTVFFLGDNERIELRHVAESRRIFALGALNAVRWLVGKSPGLYMMDDLFR